MAINENTPVEDTGVFLMWGLHLLGERGIMGDID